MLELKYFKMLEWKQIYVHYFGIRFDNQYFTGKR